MTSSGGGQATAAGLCHVAKGQHSFMKFIVKPLFDEIATQLPFFERVCVPHIDSNMAYWDTVQEQQRIKEPTM